MNQRISKSSWIEQFENRLIRFSVNVLASIDHLPKQQSAVFLANQLSRSATSPALNYGEASSAESQKDFIHKLSICLKEMNESRICLVILQFRYPAKLEFSDLITEATELAKIFATSIQTAKQNPKFKK